MNRRNMIAGSVFAALGGMALQADPTLAYAEWVNVLTAQAIEPTDAPSQKTTMTMGGETIEVLYIFPAGAPKIAIHGRDWGTWARMVNASFDVDKIEAAQHIAVE
jgi:hypothetical protein